LSDATIHENLKKLRDDDDDDDDLSQYHSYEYNNYHITLVFNNIIKHTKNTRERLTVLTSASL